MAVKLIVFGLSLLVFCVFMYIVTRLWFQGKRNFHLKIFSALGVLYSIWVLLNGINVLLTLEMRAMVYPLVQTVVCIVPPVLLIYVLNFTGLKVEKYLLPLRIMIVLMLADLLIVWTNPLHKEFISRYNGVTPIGGRLLPVHMIIAYVPILISITVLYIYIIKNIKKNRSLILIGFGITLPMSLNILYSFSIFDIGFDITPFAFIFMFGTFAVYSIRIRLFDMKGTANSEIFDSLSDALIIVDRTGTIANINPSFSKAFPNKKIVIDKTPMREVADYIQSISTKFDPPDLFEKIFSDKSDKFDKSELIDDAEITISNKNALRHYSISKDVIDDNGHYAGYIVTLADVSSYRGMIDMITELKDKADSASNAKGLFLANMSHEIRTPMNAISGMINIGKSSDDVERKNYCFEKIESATNHLLGVINDILDMSKIESGKFEISEVLFNFEIMIQGIINIITFRTDEKNQTLTVNIDKNIPDILSGDAQRLSQVITNLVGNAVKFTPEGGLINIDTKLLSINENKDEDICVIQVSVSDTGIGISPEQQARLFTSFQQAEGSTTRKFGGTGLGLSISKNIVEMMNGDIWIESELGKGSKFIFTVQLKKAKNTADLSGLSDLSPKEVGKPHKINVNNRFKGCRVLLAEDIEINREIVIALLEPASIIIDCAENGTEAVKMFSESPEKYDMIFMDVQMPEMDGYEATSLIRAINHPKASSVPIIAMTANAFIEDIEKARESGMNDHVAKPIDLNELWKKMNKYIK